MKEIVLSNLSVFLDYIKQGVEFIKDQAPLYVQELIKYHTALYFIYIVICFIILIVTLYMFFRGLKILKQNSMSDMGCAAMTIGGFGIVITTAFLIYNITCFAQVYFAPRVFVLKYLLKLTNGGC